MVGYNSSDRTTMSYVSSFHHHHIYKSRKIIQRWVYARACDALQKNTSFSCGANFFSSTRGVDLFKVPGGNLPQRTDSL